jgi:hypothetical protein
VNQIAGYSKNTVRLQNLNSETAGPGAGSSQTTVTMPTNSIINLKSLALHCKFSGQGIAAAAGSANNKRIYALCPRGGVSALVQKLSWSAGGIALDNGPTPYSVIHAVKNTTENSLDKMLTDQKVLNNSVINAYTPTGPTDTVLGQQIDLICNEWYGFTEAAPCFLDTNLLPELRLTIQWEGNNVLPIQFESGAGLGDPQAGTDATAGTCSYQLKQMFWTVDVVSFSNGLLDAMNERMMRDDGALDVVYPQYQVFSVDGVSANSGVRGGVSTMSLDRVYGLQRNSKSADRTTDHKALPLSYDLQQPPIKCSDGQVGFQFNNAFTNFATLGLGEYQFKVNNAPYPMYRETALGGYNSIMTSNARTYKHNEGSQIGSADCWKQNAFTPMISLNHPADQRFISGLDLRSINSQINWDTYQNTTLNPEPGSGDPRQLLMLTQQTSLMKIGGGRSLAVVA